MADEAAGLADTRVMFAYWGRRGAMSQFLIDVGRAAASNKRVATTLSYSRQNESVRKLQELDLPKFTFNTFHTDAGAVLQAWRIPFLRRQLFQRLIVDRTQAVIELMPHVWSPFVTPVIRAAGVRYLTIAHDAEPHPGDHRTSLAKHSLDHAVQHADRVLTLSNAVANRLISTGRVSEQKIGVMFHPDFSFRCGAKRVPPSRGNPFKLLFMGRIMDYKGLPLFLDAVDALHSEGLAVEVGVFGEGELGPNADRLAAMNAEVVNRWLTDDEITAILQRFHTMVLSYVEASQSGVAAAALGAGLPVVATPVGGLTEQIQDGQTGVIASRVDAVALADAIKRLLLDPILYAAVCQSIVSTKDQRSMTRFVQECVARSM
jgi:glycosyltransferase involved in cell wall biosynthesis